MHSKFPLNSLLIRNIFSLSLLQIMNYLFPLITVPYVVRVLGVESFGKVSFAAAFVSYFSLITDYGFNLSATRQISLNRNSKEKLSEFIKAIYSIKILLFAIVSIIFTGVIIFIPFFTEEYPLFLICFISVIGSLIYPLWYYQGLEQMKFVTRITFAVRLVSTVLIFYLVTAKDNYLEYAVLNSGSFLLIGIIAFIPLIKYFRIGFVIPQMNVLKNVFKEGSYLFLSSISMNLYTTSNTVILGLFTTPSLVGYWSAADKIRIAVQGIFTPVTQAMYPHFSKLFAESKKQALRLFRRTIIITGLAGFAVCLFVFIYAEPVTILVLGPKYTDAIVLVRIISFLPFIILMSNFFGVQLLLNQGAYKEFGFIVLSAAVLNILISVIIVPTYSSIGTAIAVNITEIYVTSIMIIYSYKKLKSKSDYV